MNESGSASSKTKMNWLMVLLVAIFSLSLLVTAFVTYKVLFGGGSAQANRALDSLISDVGVLTPVSFAAKEKEEGSLERLLELGESIPEKWAAVKSSSVISDLKPSSDGSQSGIATDNIIGYMAQYDKAWASMSSISDLIDKNKSTQVPDTLLESTTRDLMNAVGGMRVQVAGLDAKGAWSPMSILYAALLALISLGLMAVLSKTSNSKRMLLEKDSNEQNQAAILRLLDELADLADGDLTTTATVSEDFTGAIADSVNFTIDQLRRLVSRINSTAVRVSGAAQSTQQTALHLAEASDHQAQEIAGASAAINEMAVTIDQVSANASESSAVAERSVSIASNGAKVVQNTINGMDTIREQIQDTSKRIKRLGESSQEIGDIVSLINDIADQTNILALNAAIQASMAGDAGRGFAVVADEVQRLAERSAAATKQIEALVKTIQADTNEAVISMEQTTTEVVTGARLAQDAGVALEEIEGVSANLAELIQNISNAARQQASSAGHISNTMNVIQEITSQTSSGTGATAQSIGELADMALDLRESVAGFTLPAEYTDTLDDNDPFSEELPTLEQPESKPESQFESQPAYSGGDEDQELADLFRGGASVAVAAESSFDEYDGDDTNLDLAGLEEDEDLEIDLADIDVDDAELNEGEDASRTS